MGLDVSELPGDSQAESKVRARSDAWIEVDGERESGFKEAVQLRGAGEGMVRINASDLLVSTEDLREGIRLAEEESQS